jgi:hypothetical protein
MTIRYDIYVSNLKAEKLGLKKQDYIPAVWNASKKDVVKGALIGLYCIITFLPAICKHYCF